VGWRGWAGEFFEGGDVVEVGDEGGMNAATQPWKERLAG
jgi:hypothetical protein